MEKSLLRDPGSELRIGWTDKRRATIINGKGNKKRKSPCSRGCNSLLGVTIVYWVPGVRYSMLVGRS